MFLRAFNSATAKWEGVDVAAIRNEVGSIRYTADQIHSNFKALLDSLDENYQDLSELSVEFQEFKKDMDAVYAKLNRINIDIRDFGAKGDGKTDDTKAFEEALKCEGASIFVPEGTYLVHEIRMPSRRRIYGEGFKSIIKQHPDATGEKNVITSYDHSKRTEYIFIENLYIDGNKRRGVEKQSQSGARSSGVCIANTYYAKVENVMTYDTTKHGFDVTSPEYNKVGDPPTKYQPNGSRFVWIQNCKATKFGDDGFTTHFSQYIFIDNCHSYDGDGSIFDTGNTGSNNFEVDDGSSHVWLTNCLSERAVRGFEVKGHGRSPASDNVNILNCVSYQDCRAFDLRHIDHTRAHHPYSASAYHVNISNCVAIHPRYTSKNVGLTPRALIISSYSNVNVNNFTAIGDPSYDYKDQATMRFQFKSRNINLSNINIKGFHRNNEDLYVAGGAQKCDNVSISNVIITDSAKWGIRTGGSINNVSVTNANLTGRGQKDSIGVYCTNNRIALLNINTSNYENAAQIAGKKSKNFVPNNIRRGTKISSASGQVHKETGAIIATTGGCEAKGDRTVVIASSGGSTATGNRSMVMNSYDSHTEGTGSLVVASKNVKHHRSYTVVGGNSESKPSSANIKWELNSRTGNITAAGEIKAGTNYNDYAEYMESVDGKPIPAGTIVTLEGAKIRPANEGEYMVGVISKTAGIILGESAYHWKSRYLHDEYGGLVTEKKAFNTTDINGKPITEIREVPIENPLYNEDLEAQYTSRSERPEWNIVGMVGQIHITIDETVRPGDFITAKNGIATKAKNPKELDQKWRVMTITSPYNVEKGYGVALCFVR